MTDRYLSRRVAGLKPSGIRKFFDIAATMKDVISLGIGEPDFTTPEPILLAGIESLQRGETHYTSNYGILELRRELAEHFASLYGVEYDPEKEIIITVGGSEALYLAAIALLDPGDEVIIPTPCFVSYQAAVILAGGVAVEIPGRMEENFDLIPMSWPPPSLRAPRPFFLASPNNPTGAVASRERSARGGSNCREARPGGDLGRNLRPPGLWRGAYLLPLAAGHAQPHPAAGRLLQGLCHDGLAHRLRRWSRHDQRPGPHPSIHGHVRAHHRPVGRPGGAAQREQYVRMLARVRPPASTAGRRA